MRNKSLFFLRKNGPDQRTKSCFCCNVNKPISRLIRFNLKRLVGNVNANQKISHHVWLFFLSKRLLFQLHSFIWKPIFSARPLNDFAAKLSVYRTRKSGKTLSPRPTCSPSESSSTCSQVGSVKWKWKYNCSISYDVLHYQLWPIL